MTGISHIDHIALTQPFDRFDEAALFFRTVLAKAGPSPYHAAAHTALKALTGRDAEPTAEAWRKALTSK